MEIRILLWLSPHSHEKHTIQTLIWLSFFISMRPIWVDDSYFVSVFNVFCDSVTFGPRMRYMNAYLMNETC